MLYLALLGLGGAVLIGAFLAAYVFANRSRMRHRLRQVDRISRLRPGGSEGGSAAGGSATAGAYGNRALRVALSAADRAIARRGTYTKLEAQLDQAGLDLRPAEWQLRRVATAVGAGVVGLILGLGFGLVFAAAGWAATYAYRKLRTDRRARRFEDVLPEALHVVVSALRSGFSFPQALDAVVREGAEPVATEFGRAVRESRLGGELDDALLRTALRNGSKDLAWLVMAIRIQREVGGNLSEVLETAVETMRERGRLRRHIRGLSAEGRLSGLVLGGMPLVLGGFMFAVRREYLAPLYTTPLGLLMLSGSAVMMAVGVFWMRTMIKVEV